MISERSGGTRHGVRRVAIILTVGLVVVVLALLSARVITRHPPHAPNPLAPLVGAVDRANSTAGAANARNHQLENLIGGATSNTNPASP
jgi:hypothetical protein